MSGRWLITIESHESEDATRKESTCKLIFTKRKGYRGRGLKCPEGNRGPGFYLRKYGTYVTLTLPSPPQIHVWTSLQTKCHVGCKGREEWCVAHCDPSHQSLHCIACTRNCAQFVEASFPRILLNAHAYVRLHPYICKPNSISWQSCIWGALAHTFPSGYAVGKMQH